jgi:hypothetical protein
MVKNMVKDIVKVIGAFHDIGVSKEVTLEIMHELLNNSSKYSNQPENIDGLLQEKLDINQIISLKSYVLF